MCPARLCLFEPVSCGKCDYYTNKRNSQEHTTALVAVLMLTFKTDTG